MNNDKAGLKQEEIEKVLEDNGMKSVEPFNMEIAFTKTILNNNDKLGKHNSEFYKQLNLNKFHTNP